MRILISRTFRKTDKHLLKGVTLIEMMVVITILGAAFTVSYQLLKSFFSEQLESVNDLDIIQMIDYGREHAISTGETLTLQINTEKNTMGLMVFNPSLETKTEENLKMTLTDILSDNGDEDTEEKTEWILSPKNLGSGIQAFYSINGIRLSGETINSHIYPNGTADPLIIEYDRNDNPFLLIPRNYQSSRLISRESFEINLLPAQ